MTSGLGDLANLREDKDCLLPFFRTPDNPPKSQPNDLCSEKGKKMMVAGGG